MEENRKEAEYGEDIKIKSPFLSWFDNFWYHYKWQTIVALFLIFSVLICSLQMCSREEADFHMMYAGSAELSRRQSATGDTPVYNQVVNVLKKYIDDVDGDGKKVMAFTTYFSLSKAEIAEIEKDPDKEVNYTLIQDDADALSARFGIGDYSLSLVAPHVYEQYKGTGDVCAFMPLAAYAPEENELEYYSDYAIYLRSTAMYKNHPEIRDNLPEDTLIVLRIKSAAGGLFNGSKNDQAYEMAEEVLRRILAE